MDITVKQVEPLLVEDRPAPGVLELVQLWQQWGERELGHDDFQNGPLGLAHDMLGSLTLHRSLWLARGDDGTVVGSVQLELPMADNLRRGDLELCVHPDVAAAPVLDALWEALLPVLGEAERDIISIWSSAGSRDGAPRLRPSTGSGSLPSSETTEWLVEHGFVLDQVESSSVLELSDIDERLEALADGVRGSAGAYEVRQWSGSTPVELREQMAVLRGRMSTDIPFGQAAPEATRWDADRVLEIDERHQRGGRQDLWTVAVERSTGTPVAHTYLSVPREKPWLAWQEDTLVHPDHRGHRLGMLVKVENLRRLRAEHPGVRRIRTWNADENSRMLAINEALGFRADCLEGWWVRHGLPSR